MWSHPKLKNKYHGNYEYKQRIVNVNAQRVLRLEHRNAKGQTVGKVYEFGNVAAAKKAGWTYEET